MINNVLHYNVIAKLMSDTSIINFVYILKKEVMDSHNFQHLVLDGFIGYPAHDLTTF